MLIRYMRMSTAEQSLDLQRDALEKAGCRKFYEDVCSGRAKFSLRRLKRLNPAARIGNGPMADDHEGDDI